MQVSALAEAAASALQTPVTDLHKGSSGSIPPGAAGLPGLQELRGSWSGRLVAVGGGAAAAAPQLEFDLTGSSWKAGPYTCDQVCDIAGQSGITLVVRGRCHLWILHMLSECCSQAAGVPCCSHYLLMVCHADPVTRQR